MIIITKDETQYKSGLHIVMHKEVIYPPTAPEMTYILHNDKPNIKELAEWIPYMPSSTILVIVCESLPSVPKELAEDIIIHPSLNKTDRSPFQAINSIMTWGNRDRLKEVIKGVPMPLLIAYLRTNSPDDIDTFRRIGDTLYTLPQEYLEAIMMYSITPKNRRLNPPNKKLATEEHDSDIWRDTDIYAGIISLYSPEVLNEIRRMKPEELPSGASKRQKTLVDWL